MPEIIGKKVELHGNRNHQRHQREGQFAGPERHHRGGAQADEAGKGFAVAANEIKKPAKQTIEATQDIKGKIDEGIQRTTSTTVGLIVYIT